MTSGSTTSTSGAVNRGFGANEPSYTGRAVRRFEDADLLRGHGRFGDDLPVRPDTLHAAILRSPHAHAEILSVDVAGALAVPGVDCVVTSEDARGCGAGQNGISGSSGGGGGSLGVFVRLAISSHKRVSLDGVAPQ